MDIGNQIRVITVEPATKELPAVEQAPAPLPQPVAAK
jgi:hypothetical protein